MLFILWAGCIDHVLQRVHDLEQQLADQRQDVQAREEANEHYAEEKSNTEMLKLEVQLHDLDESVIDCMKRWDSQLWARIARRLVAASTPAFSTPSAVRLSFTSHGVAINRCHSSNCGKGKKSISRSCWCVGGKKAMLTRAALSMASRMH